MTLDLKGKELYEYLYKRVNFAAACNAWAFNSMDSLKVELGADLVREIQPHKNYVTRANGINTFCGVPIEINIIEPRVFKIWKDITFAEGDI